MDEYSGASVIAALGGMPLITDEGYAVATLCVMEVGKIGRRTVGADEQARR